MTPKTTGWIIFLAAVGTLMTAVGMDIIKLMNLSEMATPMFIGGFMLHIGSVIGAFIGGKMIPEDRNPSSRDREIDK